MKNNEAMGKRKLKKSYVILMVVLALLVLILALCIRCMPSCTAEPEQFDLSKSAIVDIAADMSDCKEYSVEILLPAAGRICISTYDYTEYSEIDEKQLKTKVEILDSDSKEVYKSDFQIVENRFTTDLDAGSYFVSFNTKSRPKNFDSLKIDVAYAAADGDAEVVLNGGNANSLADANGVAHFIFSVSENTLGSVDCGASLDSEPLVNFTVTAADGKELVKDCSIAGDDWNARQIFFPAGSYDIAVSNLPENGLAECSVKTLEGFDSKIVTSADTKEKAEPIAFGKPAVLGFEEKAVQWFSFTPEEGKLLSIETNGINTYYESNDEVKVSVFDTGGNKIDLLKYDPDFPFTGGTVPITAVEGVCYVSVEPANGCSCVKAELVEVE